MTKNCCVPQCRNDKNKGSAHHFHKFPKDKAIRKAWIHRLKIGWKPLKYEVVCNNHFKDSDYTLTNYGESSH